MRQSPFRLLAGALILVSVSGAAAPASAAMFECSQSLALDRLGSISVTRTVSSYDTIAEIRASWEGHAVNGVALSGRWWDKRLATGSLHIAFPPAPQAKVFLGISDCPRASPGCFSGFRSFFPLVLNLEGMVGDIPWGMAASIGEEQGHFWVQMLDAEGRALREEMIEASVLTLVEERLHRVLDTLAALPPRSSALCEEYKPIIPGPPRRRALPDLVLPPVPPIDNAPRPSRRRR